jgi:hypothetical protein
MVLLLFREHRSGSTIAPTNRVQHTGWKVRERLSDAHLRGNRSFDQWEQRAMRGAVNE